MLLPTFLGKAINPALVEAIEAIPAHCVIVTLSAGENMPIKCAFTPEYEDGDYAGLIPEYVWNGEAWIEIGFL